MSSTTVRSSAERLALAVLFLLLAGCPASETPTDGPDELSEEAATDPGDPVAAPAEVPVDAPAQEASAPDAVEPGEADAPDAPDGSGMQPRMAGRTAPQNVDRVVALLSAFEAGPPTAEQLRAATPDPEAVLLALSEDAAQPPVVRLAATRSLGTIGGQAATRRLLDLLADPSGDAGLRRAAVQGAGPLLSDSPELLAGVQARLRDDAPAVARAAVLALADVPAAREQLQTLDGEQVPPQVKTALDEVLRGGTEVVPPTATKVEPTQTRTPGRR
jgi:hypothetical protein